jgi:hypothetical protein
MCLEWCFQFILSLDLSTMLSNSLNASLPQAQLTSSNIQDSVRFSQLNILESEKNKDYFKKREEKSMA